MIKSSSKYATYTDPTMAKYIRDIETGKIPPPYRCEFRDAAGNVVTTSPIPCTPQGKPKLLFN